MYQPIPVLSGVGLCAFFSPRIELEFLSSAPVALIELMAGNRKEFNVNATWHEDLDTYLRKPASMVQLVGGRDNSRTFASLRATEIRDRFFRDYPVYSV